MFKLKHFKNLISFYSQTVFYHFFSTSPFHKLYQKTPYNMVSVLQHSIHIIKIYFSLEPKKTVMFKLKHFKNLISFYSQTVFYHFFFKSPFHKKKTEHTNHLVSSLELQRRRCWSMCFSITATSPFVVGGQQGILDVEINAEFDKAVFRLFAF